MEFAATVDVHRLTKSEDDATVTGYRAEVRVACGQCGEQFAWRGVPIGLDPRRPMASVDGTELRVPIYPASGDPDFGADGPGFSVRVHERG